MTTQNSFTDTPSVDLTQAFSTAIQTNSDPSVLGWQKSPYVQTILSSLREGTLVTDSVGKILAWNPAMEKITGLSAEQMLGRVFDPALIGLKNYEQMEVTAEECPLQNCLALDQASISKYLVVGRSGREVKVEISCSPVHLGPNNLGGAVLCLHDESMQTSMERQIKDLFEISMVDPLTQVFNRTEFERVLEQYVRAKNITDNFRCSLIIADIDYFKSINDNYNHHVGDQTLIFFASLLKKFTRSHDLVARFGGEEFLILCGNCDLESAWQRAEEIRVTLTKTAVPMLDGKCVTSSFGVAELEMGETPKDFFIRADSALLKAKESGRNRVVKALINGQPLTTENVGTTICESISGVQWRKLQKNSLIQEEFVTQTPIAMLTEQLRGFILETSAEIEQVEANFAELNLELKDDRNASKGGFFNLKIEFQGVNEGDGEPKKRRNLTYIRIVISEGKKRWFRKNELSLAPRLLRDIRRYFMISDESCRLKIDPAVTSSTRDQ